MATRRGRPTQAEAKQLDLAVREAAVATFVEMGYAGASMEAIARAAGITKRSLYARYPDKRAVFADVIPWALARYTDDGSIDEVDDDDVETALLASGGLPWPARRTRRTCGSSASRSTRPRCSPSSTSPPSR